MFFLVELRTGYELWSGDWSSDVCFSNLLARVSKETGSKALKSGRLSYDEKTDNSYLIDTSELFRVFTPKQKETVAESRSETPSGNSETPINSGGLQREIELLREQLQDRDSVVADLRQRLDKSEDERREADRKSTRLNSSH